MIASRSLFLFVFVIHVFFCGVTPAAEPAPMARFVVVDNVCAWPQLVLLRDGTIAALLHNQPSHGVTEGDIECWTSANGEFWTKAGTATHHAPNTVRMNHAAGLAKNGDLIVLCSGWTNEQQPGRPKQKPFRDTTLRPVICRSSDGGHTWTQSTEFPEYKTGIFIPFGPILTGDDGALHASCYAGPGPWHFRSDDDGRTWQPTTVIASKHNETSILPLGGERWLAAARVSTTDLYACYTDLYRSDDNGASWQGPERVTEPGEHNAHLLHLKDGRLLMSYGNRTKGQFGTMAKWSTDEGKTWSEPLRLANALSSDCGYPSSVQRSDGKIVTSYYSRTSEHHTRYHMGVTIWEVPAK